MLYRYGAIIIAALGAAVLWVTLPTALRAHDWYMFTVGSTCGSFVLSLALGSAFLARFDDIYAGRKKWVTTETVSEDDEQSARTEAKVVPAAASS